MTRLSAQIAATAAIALIAMAASGCKREETVAPPAMATNATGVGAYTYNADNVPASDVPSYASATCVRTISTPQPAAPAPQYADQAQYAGQGYTGQYRTAYAPQYYAPAPQGPQYVYTPAPRTRVIVKKRPLKRSIAIVGGSAGVGAAIGAIAAGGPGAG